MGEPERARVGRGAQPADPRRRERARLVAGLLLLDRDPPPDDPLLVRRVVERVVEPAEGLKDRKTRRVELAPRLLGDLQGTLAEREGFGPVAFRSDGQGGQPHQGPGDVGVVHALRRLADGQSLADLRRGEVGSVVRAREIGQRLERPGDVGVIRAEGTLADGQHRAQGFGRLLAIRPVLPPVRRGPVSPAELFEGEGVLRVVRADGLLHGRGGALAAGDHFGHLIGAGTELARLGLEPKRLGVEPASIGGKPRQPLDAVEVEPRVGREIVALAECPLADGQHAAELVAGPLEVAPGRIDARHELEGPGVVLVRLAEDLPLDGHQPVGRTGRVIEPSGVAEPQHLPCQGIALRQTGVCGRRGGRTTCVGR